MGYSMRTDQYRYTEYVRMTPLDGEYNYQPDWDQACDHGELYDLVNDSKENVNLYRDVNYSEVVEELADKLRAGWREQVGRGNNRG